MNKNTEIENATNLFFAILRSMFGICEHNPTKCEDKALAIIEISNSHPVNFILILISYIPVFAFLKIFDSFDSRNIEKIFISCGIFILLVFPLLLLAVQIYVINTAGYSPAILWFVINICLCAIFIRFVIKVWAD